MLEKQWLRQKTNFGDTMGEPLDGSAVKPRPAREAKAARPKDTIGLVMTV